jgi:hypothetical protein
LVPATGAAAALASVGAGEAAVSLAGVLALAQAAAAQPGLMVTVLVAALKPLLEPAALVVRSWALAAKRGKGRGARS